MNIKKVGEWWSRWKSILLIILFQVVFQSSFWAAEKIGFETGDWSVMNFVGLSFVICVWGLPIVVGIFSGQDKVKSALRFFIFNTGAFLALFFILGYYINISRGIFPTWPVFFGG